MTTEGLEDLKHIVDGYALAAIGEHLVQGLLFGHEAIDVLVYETLYFGGVEEFLQGVDAEGVQDTHYGSIVEVYNDSAVVKNKCINHFALLRRWFVIRVLGADVQRMV